MRLAPTRLYLDTARLGLMNSSAQRANTDFAKLLSVPTPVLVEHEADWFQKFNEIMQG